MPSTEQKPAAKKARGISRHKTITDMQFPTKHPSAAAESYDTSNMSGSMHCKRASSSARTYPPFINDQYPFLCIARVRVMAMLTSTDELERFNEDPTSIMARCQKTSTPADRSFVRCSSTLSYAILPPFFFWFAPPFRFWKRWEQG